MGVSKKLPWQCHQAIIDQEGRYVILQGLLGQQQLKIVGIYTPNRQQQIFWNDLKLLLDFGRYSSMILLGDFNATLDAILIDLE